MYQFLRGNFRWLLGGFLLTLFSSFGQTFFISASVGEWQELFAMSHGEFGRLYMIATLSSALCLPFVGRWVDALREDHTVALAVPMLVAAVLLAAFARSVLALGLAVFLLRLFGQGMMTHIALTATGRWFHAQRGRAVSLVGLGHHAGEATLPLLYSSVAVQKDFQTGWLSAAGMLVVTLPLVLWAYRKPRVPEEMPVGGAEVAPKLRQWTRGEVLRDRMFWLIQTGVLAPPFIVTTIFYHQDYLAQQGGWPPNHFALSLSLFAVVTVICALGAGALIDSIGAVRMLSFFLVPLGLACLALYVGGPPQALFGVMGLLGVSTGISSTLFGALWPEVYGVLHLGAVRSVIVSAMVFSTALGPGVTGTLIDQGIGLPEQFGVLSLYCVAATTLMVLVSRRLRQRLAD